MNPNPISYIETLSQNETDPFRKLHKRKDLGEVLTKIPCMIALAHALSKTKIPSKLKAVMLEKLKAPSIGVWTQIRNEFTDSPSYKAELSPLFAELNDKVKNIFNQTMAEVRNKLAHGADTQEATVKKYSGEMENQLKPLLLLSFFKNLEFKTQALEGELSLFHKVLCTVNDKTYDLSPFVYFKGETVLLFNGYDTDFVPTYVFYSENATMLREPFLKEVYREFLPMREWQENPSTYFFVRTPVYSKHHLFREELLSEVLEWCKTGSESVGYLEAVSGMGKTAFLSKVIEDISTAENLSTVEFFFESGKDHSTLDFFERYFVERTDEYLTYERQSTKLEDNFRETIKAMQENGKTVLFLLDAPDKAPTEVNKLLNVLLSMGGRILLTKSPAVDQYDKWKESKKTFTLPILTEENFEFIWDQILGGRTFKNPTKIEKIKKIALAVSAGNPRVIRLWIGSIRQDRTGLGKRPLEMMPGELQNYYESLFKNRSERGMNMTIIFGILFLLTATKEPISIETMAEKLQTSTEEIETWLDPIIDFVVPTPMGYLLFHKTLGEFLKLKYPTPYLMTIKKSGWEFRGERDYIKRNLATF
jgi:hypothetical protein